VSRRVFLFDLDGTLVEPRGYRLALEAALNRFTRRMGIGDQYPGEETISLFEAQNVTSEWDILPLCLSAILDALLDGGPALELPGDLLQACDTLRACEAAPPRVDYPALALRLGAQFQEGQLFSELALALCRPEAANPLFPRLQGHPLLEALLGRTRDVRASPVTRIFQQFVLGSEVYEQIYGLPWELPTPCPSFLRAYDRPLLEASLREALLARWQEGSLDLAAFTIRPSLLRGEQPSRGLPYSPEAEFVLRDLGLEAIPLVGYGQVCRLAEIAGISPSQAAKPSTIQALGAIGAAITRDELQAMLAAERWVNYGESAHFAGLPALEIHVFEDSAASIRAVRQAAGMLSGICIPAEVHAWGIAHNPAKAAALQAAGATVCADVNEAVQAALMN